MTATGPSWPFGSAAIAIVLAALGFGWIATPRAWIDAARVAYLAGIEPERLILRP